MTRYEGSIDQRPLWPLSARRMRPIGSIVGGNGRCGVARGLRRRLAWSAVMPGAAVLQVVPQHGAAWRSMLGACGWCEGARGGLCLGLAACMFTCAHVHALIDVIAGDLYAGYWPSWGIGGRGVERCTRARGSIGAEQGTQLQQRFPGCQAHMADPISILFLGEIQRARISLISRTTRPSASRRLKRGERQQASGVDGAEGTPAAAKCAARARAQHTQHEFSMGLRA
eukprot:jgi/Ulvmu1/9392/UM051_0019.1